MRYVQVMAVYIGIVLFLLLVSKLGPSVSLPAFQTGDNLLEEIKNKAEKYEEPAQDAYIDRVWKKTPGRNGLQVQVHASYRAMKKKGKFDPKLLQFKEIPPKKSLQDLPPAPIYRGHPEKNMVAFLINVSWGTEYIPKILKTLKTHDIKATFFIEGKWAKENKEVVQMIYEQGHLIGNHAYNHPDMATLSEADIQRQIDDTNAIIEAIIKERPRYFAPPSGSYTDKVVEYAHDADMETILWTVDTIDWKNPSVSVMINRVMSKLHPGAMILMHPTSSVAQGLDSLIKQIKEEGYRIDTVDRLLDEAR